MAGHACQRLAILGASCPQVWPDDDQMWCPSCQAGFQAWLADWEQQVQHHQQFEGSLPPEAPCPLESHQVEALADWFGDDRPAWSLKQLRKPCPN